MQKCVFDDVACKHLFLMMSAAKEFSGKICNNVEKLCSITIKFKSVLKESNLPSYLDFDNHHCSDDILGDQQIFVH